MDIADVILQVIVCLIAGMGAGIGTGFAGMSAVTVISPMLITFLGVPTYEAVGIGLASDILASAVSAGTYAKNKNIDIKNGIVLLISVLIMTVVGSFAASWMPNNAMGSFSVLFTLFLGVKFLVRPVKNTKDDMRKRSKLFYRTGAVVGGIYIGFVCGFMGAGGGLMMLLILTSVLHYELKTAVGTSVFVMTFTALIGAASHFYIGGMPDVLLLVLCSLFTLIFSRIAAVISNRSDSKTLNQLTGLILTVLAIVVIIVRAVSGTLI